jgi:hypothetical protein
LPPLLSNGNSNCISFTALRTSLQSECTNCAPIRDAQSCNQNTQCTWIEQGNRCGMLRRDVGSRDVGANPNNSAVTRFSFFLTVVMGILALVFA